MEEGQGNVQERQAKGETAKQNNSSVPNANKVLSPIGVEESVLSNGWCVTYTMMPGFFVQVVYLLLAIWLDASRCSSVSHSFYSLSVLHETMLDWDE